MRAAALQRKCACGQHTAGGEQCEDCKKKGQSLQRRAISSSGPAIAPPIVHEVLRSPGQPLDQATRAFMEPRFGHDFSGVRVHTGERAAESARAVNALAYTVGSDVVFAATRYRPETQEGRRLLAHELAHSVQQRDIVSFDRSTQIKVGPASDVFELEAEKAAEQVNTLGQGESVSDVPLTQLQRVPADAGTQPPAQVSGPPDPQKLQVSGKASPEAAKPAAIPSPPPKENLMYLAPSSSTLGIFDATLDRSRCLLTLQKKICFDFLDAPPANKYGPSSDYSPWTDAKRKDFQHRFIETTTRRWSSQYVLVPAAPCMSETCKSVSVALEIVPVKLDEQHTVVHVGNRTADGSAPEMGVTPLGDEAHLSSGELNPSHARGLNQVRAEHEVGHMLGLAHGNAANCGPDPNSDKCYGKPGSPEEKDIMGAGSDVSAKDYSPFAFALEQFDTCKWQAQPKNQTGGSGGIWGFLTGTLAGRMLGLGAIGAGIGALAGGGIGALVGAGVGIAAGLAWSLIEKLAE